MDTTLSNYNVKFSTSADFALKNKITTINGLMSQFISDHYTLSEANRLLSGVNSVISEETDSYWTYTQSNQLAVMSASTVKIYEDMDVYEDDNNAAAGYTLPSTDFKAIIEAWRDYLNQSPFKLGE